MYKASGIVRRVDNLGRIVVPKEIRKTMHIRENDPMEIFIGNNGEIIFKKYSFLAELGSDSEQYAKILNKIGNHPVAICDTGKIISAAGFSQKGVTDRHMSGALTEIMSRRESIFYISPGGTAILPFDGSEYFVLTGMPIISAGDVYGYVMFLTDDENACADRHAQNLVEIAAAFLGSQIEG